MGIGRTDRNGIGIGQEQRAGITVMYRGVGSNCGGTRSDKWWP